MSYGSIEQGRTSDVSVEMNRPDKTNSHTMLITRIDACFCRIWIPISVYCLALTLMVACSGLSPEIASPSPEATHKPWQPSSPPTLPQASQWTPTQIHLTLPASSTPNTAPSPTPLPRHFIIGYSVAGRPLEVYQFGSGTRKLMVVAGIHGGYEWNTTALADQLISHLCEHSDMIPEEVTLFILRCLNPDGLARSKGVLGRTNENGVDLNRNWPAFWQAELPTDGCWPYFPTSAGSHPASEPETLALMYFLTSRRVEGVISYHSAAQGIFPGGQPPDPSSRSLAEALAAVSTYPYPPIDTGCQYTGQLIDWASENGIAAVDIELSNHQDTDLSQNLNILTVFLHWQP